MDYITCIEVAYLLYKNESLINYIFNKSLKTKIIEDLTDKIIYESVKYMYKRINNIN